MLLTTMCQTPLQALSKTDKIIIFVELNSRRKAIKKQISRTSLMIQWLRICLPMQGTWVQSLVQEYPMHVPHAVGQLNPCTTEAVL